MTKINNHYLASLRTEDNQIENQKRKCVHIIFKSIIRSKGRGLLSLAPIVKCTTSCEEKRKISQTYN